MVMAVTEEMVAVQTAEVMPEMVAMVVLVRAVAVIQAEMLATLVAIRAATLETKVLTLVVMRATSETLPAAI